MFPSKLELQIHIDEEIGLITQVFQLHVSERAIDILHKLYLDAIAETHRRRWTEYLGYQEDHVPPRYLIMDTITKSLQTLFTGVKPRSYLCALDIISLIHEKWEQMFPISLATTPDIFPAPK